MELDQCIEFTRNVTGEMSGPQDPRVVRFMNTYDHDKNGKIKYEYFSQFFIDACVIGKDDTLRSNLRHLGYAQNLSKLQRDGDHDNILQVRKSKEDLPRYKIAKNKD